MTRELPPPPPGWTFIAAFPADSDAWQIQWLDATGAAIGIDPIVGFILWQDATGAIRTDPIAWYGPTFPETTQTPYRILSPHGYKLDPHETPPAST